MHEWLSKVTIPHYCYLSVWPLEENNSLILRKPPCSISLAWRGKYNSKYFLLRFVDLYTSWITFIKLINLNASFYFLGFFSSIKQDWDALVTKSNDYLIFIILNTIEQKKKTIEIIYYYLAKFVFANCINRQRME